MPSYRRARPRRRRGPERSTTPLRRRAGCVVPTARPRVARAATAWRAACCRPRSRPPGRTTQRRTTGQRAVARRSRRSRTYRPWTVLTAPGRRARTTRKQAATRLPASSPPGRERSSPGAGPVSAASPLCRARRGFRTLHTGPSSRLAGTSPTQKVMKNAHGAMLAGGSAGPTSATVSTRVVAARASSRSSTRRTVLSSTR